MGGITMLIVFSRRAPSAMCLSAVATLLEMKCLFHALLPEDKLQVKVDCKVFAYNIYIYIYVCVCLLIEKTV